MARPDPRLGEWLRHGHLGVPADDDLVLSTIEHRLAGQLATQTSGAGLPQCSPEVTRVLTGANMRARALNRSFHALGARVSVLLQDAAAVTPIVLKGIGLESLWYDSVGERPTTDLDLFFAPRDEATVRAAILALDPECPFAAQAAELVSKRQLQHVDLLVDGAHVDLHFDPLKLGVWSRHAATFESSAVTFDAENGGELRTLGAECALVQITTHLNKDAFSYLGAFVDIQRILSRADVDWDLVDHLVEGDGLGVVFWCSLAVVVRELGLPAVPEPVMRGPRRALWESVWRPDRRLQGHDGRRLANRYQRALPLCIEDRPLDVLRELRRRAFPPSDLYVVHRIDPGRVQALRSVFSRDRL